MKNLLKITLFVIMLCFLSGCATRYEILVEANSTAQDIKNINYVLVPDSDEYAKSLQFIEFSGQVENLLKEKGLKRVYDYSEANTVILLRYKMSSEDVQRSYSTPIYGQTGTNTQVIGNMIYNRPTYGVTGYTANTETITISTCSLTLNAIELSNGQLDDELWNVIAVTTCDEGLRSAFPFMVTAIKNHIRKNSKRVTVIIDAKNPNVVIREE